MDDVADEGLFKQIARGFRCMDLNGDKSLSRAEFKRVLQVLDRETFTDSSVDLLLSRYDADGDGRLDIDEFVKWLSRPASAGGEFGPLLSLASNVGDAVPTEAILKGYSRMRQDKEIVLRSGSSQKDLRIAEMLSRVLRNAGLKSKAVAGMETMESDALTVWLVTPKFGQDNLAKLKSVFDSEQSIIIYPGGMKHCEWITQLLVEGIYGPTVEIGMTHDALARAIPEDIDLMQMQWMGRIWGKLMRRQGVRCYEKGSELCLALYRLILDPQLAVEDRGCTTLDGTPHIVGFVGSTFFSMPWVCKLSRQVAVELNKLNKMESHKEIVICTAGYRNLNAGMRSNADNQGVGYTVSQEYYNLGGNSFHILPEVATERDFSASADQLQDGSFLPCDHGLTLFAGKDNDEHLDYMAGVCDIIFLVEGGPGAATQAKAALANNQELIPVVPVRASGGAASGKFSMPRIKRPIHIDEEAWNKVAHEDIQEAKEMPEEEIIEMAKAMAKITRSTIYPLDAIQELNGTKAHPRQWVMAATEELKKEIAIPCGARICILGSTKFNCSDSEPLVKALARSLNELIPKSRAVFITGGLPGVQETFAKHCGDGSRLWHLLPNGSKSDYGNGKDVHAGDTLDDRKLVFGEIGDIYLTVEGGPGVSQEANSASTRGAYVVPLIRTGGASEGMFNFPKEALQKPKFVNAKHWSLLSDKNANVEETVSAVVAIVEAAINSIHPNLEPPQLMREDSSGQTPVANKWQQIAAATAALKTHFFDGTRVCILGSKVLRHPDSKSLIMKLASDLGTVFEDGKNGKAVFITSCISGAQEIFAQHCGNGKRVWNLMPANDQNGSGHLNGHGQCAGKDADERGLIFGAVGDVLITFEGGPTVASEARKAVQRGAIVIPFGRLGGASSGMFDFPEEASLKPQWVTDEQWARLHAADVPLEESVSEAVQVILKIVAEKTKDLSVQREVIVPDWKLPADKFASPTDVLEKGKLSAFKTLLKISEKGFRTYGRWCRAELANMLQILSCIRVFLLDYLKRSRNSHNIHFMKKAYIFAGSKFRRVYGTIVEDVIKAEDNYEHFVEVVDEEGERLKHSMASASTKQPSNGIGYDLLFQVYRDAHASMARLNRFCEHIAGLSKAKFLQAPLKRMWRSMEKMIFKYSPDGELQRAAAELKDVARAALEGNTTTLLAAFRAICADSDVTVLRIKNRFSKPTDMGWADCQLMLVFRDMDIQHVCEIQLVHHQLMVVRSNMKAHREYTHVRAASELLMAYGEEVPELNPMVRNAMYSCKVKDSLSVSFPSQFATARSPSFSSLADFRAAHGNQADVLGDAEGSEQVMAIAFGIEDASLPLGGRVSLRWETEEFIVFDSPKRHAPLHLSVMPTAWRIPDWTALLAKPALSLDLIEKMWQVVEKAASPFLRNEQFRDCMFCAPENGWPSVIEDEWVSSFCRGHGFVFFEGNAEENQLLLHFVLPPLFPWWYHDYLNRRMPGDIIRLERLIEQLQFLTEGSKSCTEQVREALKETSFSDEDHQYLTSGQKRLARWREIFVGMANDSNGVFTIDHTGFYVPLKESADDVKDADTQRLSAYGKPSLGVEPSGTFYCFPKGPGDLRDDFVNSGAAMIASTFT